MNEEEHTRFRDKCEKFVLHIQRHLNNREGGLKLHRLRDKPFEVGCAICGKTIDEIDETEDYDGVSNE